MIDETEELLSTVAVSHNHWFGRRELIELGWELRDPDMIEYQRIGAGSLQPARSRRR